MEYNTQQKKLPLPEYGRSIQNMVDHALTLEDRSERQRCANTIINIMRGMFPHLRDVPDFKHKLWDHLAIMSGFQLDIDYPYEIIKVNKLYTKPEVIPYPHSRIRYRHYGRMLETLISKAIEFPEGEEKKHLIALIANHMRKSFITWNKETVNEEKIFDDLVEYTKGAIRPGEDTLKLMGIRMAMHRRPRPAGGQHTNHSSHNNNNHNNQRRYIK